MIDDVHEVQMFISMCPSSIIIHSKCRNINKTQPIAYSLQLFFHKSGCIILPDGNILDRNRLPPILSQQTRHKYDNMTTLMILYRELPTLLQSIVKT